MARGRLISKSLSTSHRFTALYDVCPDVAEFCQLLYTLLVVHSDDHGRLHGGPRTIKLLTLPASPRVEREFAIALRALHRVRLIHWYTAAGRQVLAIEQF